MVEVVAHHDHDQTTDPRAGETVYALKNVRLAEPAPGLFAVPADYPVQ